MWVLLLIFVLILGVLIRFALIRLFATIYVASDTIVTDSTGSQQSIEAQLRAEGYDDQTIDAVGNELKLPKDVRAIDIINVGLGCAVKPIEGDQCPVGYLAVRRKCLEGYCCVLKESPAVNNAGVVLAANMGVGLLSSLVLDQMISTVVAKRAVKQTATVGTNVASTIADKMFAKRMAQKVLKLTTSIVAKVSVRIASLAGKAAGTASATLAAAAPTGPFAPLISAAVTAAVMTAELVNLSIDLYDPRGFMQFTSSESFAAIRDYVEHEFITTMKEIVPGPPFLYPVQAVLTELVKTADGEASVCAFATFAEMGTSIAWLRTNKPAIFESVIMSAIDAMITVTSDEDTCVASTDACTAHTDEAACAADPSGECTFAAGKCVNSNVVQGLLNEVPLAIRDAHFLAAVKLKSPASAELISVFDRRVHTWFKGATDFPYAVSLSAKGQDLVNRARVDAAEPMAFITRSYRDVGTEKWTMREKNVDFDGVSDIDRTSTTLNTTTEVPRMIDKTIPAPLCLMTMNGFLRSLCEDKKSGGIETAAKVNDKLGIANPPPPTPLERDNLDPMAHGVRFDPNTARCNFTTAYCNHAGLTTVTNQLGQLDCSLAQGQGAAETIFGTTLVRSLVASAENTKQTILGLLNPANYYKKKPGETCHALTECAGVQIKNRKPGTYVSCCPATAEVGQKLLELTASGAAIGITAALTLNPPAAIAATALLDRAAQLPRTCQVMDWTRTGAIQTPYCPFDPVNPMKGPPLKDGTLCGMATTCERCESKTQSFWKSKGITACGIEPKWENGQRCAPGVTCNMCRNGYAAWDDGAHRCGPKVAGTTVALGGACAYNNHCIGYTDAKEGTRTMCCDQKCVRAVLDNAAWYCPGGVLGKTKDGGACTIGGTCEGYSSVTERYGCCNGTCQKQTRVNGLWRCPAELVKDKADGTRCVASECLRCKNPSSFWYSTSRETCGREPRLADGMPCALGTTCNRCANPSSMWSDAQVRCGKQPENIWSDGVDCLPGVTCQRFCKNPATRWRNGRWYCGKQPPPRCCADTTPFLDKCLLKTSVSKLPTGCTPGLYDPGDNRCHGVAYAVAASRC